MTECGGSGFPYFCLELDTAAPVVSFGVPSNNAPGETLVVPYTVNEPWVVGATLTLGDGRQVAGVVTEETITVEVPDDAPSSAVLTVSTKDDVWNEGVSALAVQLDGVVQPSPPPVPAYDISGGDPGRRESFVLSGTVIAVHRKRYVVPGTVRGIPGPQPVPVTVNLPGLVGASRSVVMTLPGRRGAAPLTMQRLREDEELLLLL